MTRLKHGFSEIREDCGGAADLESPLLKSPEADDPMRMEAELVMGDPQVMLDCLIEEFARLGWDANRIARMFENPFFLASHGLAKRFGQGAVRERIQQTLQRCGVFRFEITERTPVGKPRKSPHPGAQKSRRDYERRS